MLTTDASTANRARKRRAWGRIGAIAAAATAALAAPTAASAQLADRTTGGTYGYSPCHGWHGSELTSVGNKGWVAENPSQWGYTKGCENGSITANMTLHAPMPMSAGIGWRFIAPDHTRVTRFLGHWSGWSYSAGGPYTALHMFGDGVDSGPRYNHSGFTDNSFDFAYLNARTFIAAIWCAQNTGGGCPAGNNSGHLWVTNPRIELRDDTSPTGHVTGGSMHGASRVSGHSNWNFVGNDTGSGIRVSRLYIDGNYHWYTFMNISEGCKGAAWWSMSYYGSSIPCTPGTSGSYTVDTRQIADGYHQFKLFVEDAAGNRQAIYDRQVLVANNPPVNTAPPTYKGGEEHKQPLPGMMLDTDPGKWSGPNLSYTYQWQRCDVEGGSCTNIPGATGRSYRLGDIDRNHRLKFRVTAANLAGTVSKETALTGVVPAAAAETVDEKPAENEIETAADKTDSAEPTAAAVPEAKVVGAATPANRGAFNGTVAGGKAGEACLSEKATLIVAGGGERVVRIGYRSQAAIAVRLLCAVNGRAIAGAELQTATMIPGRRQAIPGTLRTDRNGNATVRVPRGASSRNVTVTYRMFPRSDIANAAVTLRVAVRGKMTLKTKRLNGNTVRFSGRLLGGHIPPSGTQVTLQWRDGSRWRPVATVASSRNGRFRYTYRFTGRARGQLFHFRAVVQRGQTSYPFLPASSQQVRARG